MPVGVKLIDLRRELRAESGQSLNIAQSVNSQPTQDIMLDRQQRELWGQYEWPHLKYWEDIPINAGQSSYDYPVALPFDAINHIYWIATPDENWNELDYGMHGYDIRATPQQGWPPRKWANAPQILGGVTVASGKIVITPVPIRDGIMRIEGQAPINPLMSDNDTCVIDSKAIVLFAAAEILATQKVEAAQLKLTKAQSYLRRLLANQGADKRKMYLMNGITYQRRMVPYMDYIPQGG